jgi:pimeloyl-ACP methyl ester carboxylesterase
MFLAGSLDPIITSGSGAAAVQALPHTVPGLRRTLTVDGAGHFIQQERPQIVNEALIEFLRTLPA